jgi:hypothetical protein
MQQEVINNPERMPEYAAYLGAGLATGIKGVTEDFIVADLQKTRRLSERRSVELDVLGDNPQSFLDTYKTAKDLRTDYPNLTPGDFQDLRHMATSQKGRLIEQKDKALNAFMEDVTQKAVKGMSPKDMRDTLTETPGLTDIERTRAMNTFMSSYRTWNEGGTKENPWRTTQNYPALMEVQLAIDAGQAVTSTDVWRAMLAGGTVNFSRTDALNLIGQLPDKKDTSLKSDFADEWLKQIDELYMDEDRKIPTQNIQDWATTKDAVRDIIKTNYPNYVKADKEIQAVLGPAKQRASKGFIQRWLERAYKLSTVGLVPNLSAKGAVRGAGKAIYDQFVSADNAPPVTITNLEDIPKLPSGTEFVYQGQEYRRD